MFSNAIYYLIATNNVLEQKLCKRIARLSLSLILNKVYVVLEKPLNKVSDITISYFYPPGFLGEQELEEVIVDQALNVQVVKLKKLLGKEICNKHLIEGKLLRLKDALTIQKGILCTGEKM
ncbi:Hypothetical protein SRAE_X000169400 [Strongyloides ratti]|uniref:Uncharacterized protein n=1 Tax=Strongyloides ratti TaxID=34506 RepID=A0A090MPC3_STRRB|nr:Hypothetical protein SRAE_X000169400 [Strongyloides ratti]CEF59952.1 Hypothetical protein SRAE_X000169400 [Strongyloides ratti]